MCKNMLEMLNNLCNGMPHIAPKRIAIYEGSLCHIVYLAYKEVQRVCEYAATTCPCFEAKNDKQISDIAMVMAMFITKA